MPERGAKVQNVFLDSDLRFSVPGLVEICKRSGIEVAERHHGELIVFVNVKRDQIKVIACNNTDQPVMASWKCPGRMIDLRIIREIPRAFRGSGEIDFHEAAEKAFIKSLPERMRGMAEEKLH